PSVSRKTSKDVALSQEDTGSFILSGTEDLIPVPIAGGNPLLGVTRYRPRTEGPFARIELHRDTNTCRDSWGENAPKGVDDATYPGETPALHAWDLAGMVPSAAGHAEVSGDSDSTHCAHMFLLEEWDCVTDGTRWL